MISSLKAFEIKKKQLTVFKSCIITFRKGFKVMNDITRSKPIFIDTKTIIVNLLKEDKKDYLPLDRLQDLLNYIYTELLKMNKLREYRFFFSVNFDAIERTVIYNHEIFVLDLDEENILLRNPQSIEYLAQQYTLDEVLQGIVRKFAIAA